MSAEKLLEIKAAIYEVGLLFNNGPTEDRINAYAKALQNYSPRQITFAFNQVILSGSAFFPSLAEVLKHLRPAEEKIDDQANLLVGEAIAAACKYSIYDKDKNVLDEVSPEVREIIQSFGGVLVIKDYPSDSNGTLRAQLRDIAKGVLGKASASKKNNHLKLIGLGEARKSVEFQTVDYSGFLINNEGA